MSKGKLEIIWHDFIIGLPDEMEDDEFMYLIEYINRETTRIITETEEE